MRTAVLDQLRVFSFLSQERVPTSGAFAVLPMDDAGALPTRGGATPRPAHAHSA